MGRPHVPGGAEARGADAADDVERDSATQRVARNAEPAAIDEAKDRRSGVRALGDDVRECVVQDGSLGEGRRDGGGREHTDVVGHDDDEAVPRDPPGVLRVEAPGRTPALQHDDDRKAVAKEGEDGGAAVRRIVDVSRVPRRGDRCRVAGESIEPEDRQMSRLLIVAAMLERLPLPCDAIPDSVGDTVLEPKSKNTRPTMVVFIKTPSSDLLFAREQRE